MLKSFGGVFYDDHSEGIVAPSAGRADPSAALVFARWQALDLQRDALDARTLNQAKREFAVAAAEAPETHDEADDWSDL